MFYRFQASFGYSPYLWEAPPRKSSLVATLREPTSPEAPSPPFQALLTPFSAYSCNILRCGHIHLIFNGVKIFVQYFETWKLTKYFTQDILVWHEHWAGLLLCCLRISWKFDVSKKSSFYSLTVFWLWAGFGTLLKNILWFARYILNWGTGEDDDENDDGDDNIIMITMTTVLFSHAWQRRSPPSLFPDLIVGPRIFKISFQSREKNSSHLLVAFVRRQGNVSQKIRFSRSPTQTNHMFLFLFWSLPPLDHPDFLMIVLMFLVWCSHTVSTSFCKMTLISSR